MPIKKRKRNDGLKGLRRYNCGSDLYSNNYSSMSSEVFRLTYRECRELLSKRLAEPAALDRYIVDNAVTNGTARLSCTPWKLSHQ